MWDYSIKRLLWLKQLKIIKAACGPRWLLYLGAKCFRDALLLGYVVCMCYVYVYVLTAYIYIYIYYTYVCVMCVCV